MFFLLGHQQFEPYGLMQRLKLYGTHNFNIRLVFLVYFFSQTQVSHMFSENILFVFWKLRRIEVRKCVFYKCMLKRYYVIKRTIFLSCDILDNFHYNCDRKGHYPLLQKTTWLRFCGARTKPVWHLKLIYDGHSSCEK